MEIDNDKRNDIVKEVVSLGSAAVGGTLIYATVRKRYPMVAEWFGKALASWLNIATSDKEDGE